MGGHPLTAVSNRLAVPLRDARGKIAETFIVRAQNMHICLRMAAKIVQTYGRAGPLMVRAAPFDFEGAYDSFTEDHERKFNPDRWVAVYHAGKLVFESGTRHPFLDVIEKCDAKNPGNYDESVHVAEDMFAKMGKPITINHDSNIGFVITVGRDNGRCGLILRNPNKRTTFNFIAEDKGENKVTITQCLVVAAAYLEGIQIAFHIGMTNEKLRLGLITRYSDDDKRADSGRRRLGRLNAEIRNFENSLDVRYRPEKPEFSTVVIDAEYFARDLYAPQKLVEGE